MNKVIILMVLLIVALAVAACGSVRSFDNSASGVAESASDPTPTVSKGDAGAEVTESEVTAQREDDGKDRSDDVTPQRSFAGTIPAPEFPPGLDWLNTDRPLTLDQLKGKVDR